MTSPRPNLKKVLVCNRGEIAIRVFRSCTELGIRTVAIYSHEDKLSLHRYKADEAYQCGVAGAPVQSYLDVEKIVAIAKRAKVSAIHPGYGFLSERYELRQAAEREGIVFVGPSVETLKVAGDKVQTRILAQRIGVPTIPGSGLISELKEAQTFAGQSGYPLMIKAAYGGGGRGMRLAENAEQLAEQFGAAQAEAKAAFGRGEVFLERYVRNPKHLEVQLLGDGTGEVVHLFERDCSVQRRHQKVVEFAPALTLTSEQREKLLGYGIALGRELSLLSAATAEFLMSESGEIFFIEVNPRIQVEHTVTEQITGIDIVQQQLRIASGCTLAELGLSQGEIKAHGVAIQCRITTEDPRKGFMPDYGRLLAYRSASGFGIRLDAGSAFTGAEITPFYDSLLVKVTAQGREMSETAARMRRALSEFRIRGVSTNIPFLENLLQHQVFLTGEARTSFLETYPEVFQIKPRKDRANKLLRFLADVTVNGHQNMPKLQRPAQFRIAQELSPFAANCRYQRSHPDQKQPAKGWRDLYLELDRKEFFQRVKQEKRLLITDTTFRDAHQSLLATRVRTYDLIAVADQLALKAPQLFSLEMWGGATFDVCLRFLREDPWERLTRIREAVPNILLQMLLRGTNAVGYKSYPDNVITGFIREAQAAGIDIFRIFDSLNNVDRMVGAINSVRESGAIAEACICYTGDLLDEEGRAKNGQPSKFNLSYYCKLAKQLADAGADILAIKDMAGLLRPYAAESLIKALKDTVDLPIHFHTHDTAGIQAASYLKAAEAGVDIVDCAFAAMSGVTSQPCLEGVVAALAGTERDSGLVLEDLTPFSSYWEAVRTYYSPFESDLRAATAEVYANEIPGGQYSNFRPQAESLGLGERWNELKATYRDVNTLFGNIVKVTPSSKVVGDLALFMVANGLNIDQVRDNARELDFPASVIDFFAGDIGIPFGGFPEPLRSDVLRLENKAKADFSREAAPELEPADFNEAQKFVDQAMGAACTVRDALSYLLYPHVYEEYAAVRRKHGNLMLLPTIAYFYGLQEGEEIEVDLEAGKRLFISLVAVSEPEENGERTVFFELNGQPRSITIADRRIAPEKTGNQPADPANPTHISAPLAGILVGLDVAENTAIEKDQALFTLEAMKMQTVVRAPRKGKIIAVELRSGTRVEVGDLILQLSVDEN